MADGVADLSPEAPIHTTVQQLHVRQTVLATETKVEDVIDILARLELPPRATPDTRRRDMQSANGTFLDDTELTPGVRTEIRPGQVLRFGDHHARIVIG